jgi:hypothetical protein
MKYVFARCILYQCSHWYCINDLHHSIAYRLFQALCFVFRLNTMSREDGLTSILRGFKKKNCYNFQKKLNFKTIKFIEMGFSLPMDNFKI